MSEKTVEEKLAEVVTNLVTADTVVTKLLKDNSGMSFFPPYKEAKKAGQSIKDTLVVLNKSDLSSEDKVTQATAKLNPANTVVDTLLKSYSSMSSSQLYKDAKVAGEAVKAALVLLG